MRPSRSRSTTASLAHALRGRRIFHEQMSGANRAWAETTAAVRALAMQHRFGAGRTERTFEAADHRFGRIRRQALVAAFAVGTELEHARSPSSMQDVVVLQKVVIPSAARDLFLQVLGEADN